jgi:hypothetical protein
MPDPQQQNAGIPAPPPTPDVKNTTADKIGSVLGAVSQGGLLGSISDAIEKHHQKRLAEAQMDHDVMAEKATKLSQTPQTDPGYQQLQQDYDIASARYEKSVGQTKEIKDEVKKRKLIADHHIAQQQQKMGGPPPGIPQASAASATPQASGQPPQAQTQPPAPAQGAASGAAAAPAAAPSATPTVGPPITPPPAPRSWGDITAGIPTEQQGMADSRAMSQYKQASDIESAAKIRETEAAAKARPPATEFSSWQAAFQAEHGHPPTTQDIDAHVADTKKKLSGDEPMGKALVDQTNAAMLARYQVLNPGKPLPPYFTLPPNATGKDYERIDKLMEGTEKAQGIKDKPPSYSATPGDVGETAKAIMAGESSPVLTDYSFRDRTAIAAALHKGGYNQALAQQDYRAVQRHLATLNGAQQTRLKQAIEFTADTLPQLQSAYDKLASLAPRSGFKILNKGTMAAMKQLPGEAGSAAQQLDSLIADFTSELGTVYKGGNSSTDESLALAAKNISGDWNEQTFKDAMKRISTSIGIRRNSMSAVGAAGVSADSPYERKDPQGPMTAPPSGSPVDDLVTKYKKKN